MVQTKTTRTKHSADGANRKILQSVHSNVDIAPIAPTAKPSFGNDAIPTANSKRTKETATTKAHPYGGSHPKDDVDLQKVAFDALHNILLNGGHPISGTEGNADGTTSSDAANATTIRQLLNLFGAACSNLHVPILLRHNLSMKDQHLVITTALRNLPSSGKAKKMFQSLHQLIQFVRSNYIMTNSSMDDAMETDSEMKVPTLSGTNSRQQQKEGYLFLQYATLCVTASFEGIVAQNQHQSMKSNNSLLSEVFHVAETLHDLLDCMNDDTDEANATFQAIVALCEQWWLQSGYEKESIIRNTLPTLLGNVVGVTDPKSSDIKRLYQLRTALSIIDYDDSESQSFVSLLLRITSTPACIRHPDGKKLVAYLLSDPEFQYSTLQSQVHLSIRVQIPNNQPSIVQHYSDIYYMAWKEVCSCENHGDHEGNGGLRNTFEMDVLSDYVYASIYAEQTSLVPLIHILLSKWYNYHPMMKHTVTASSSNNNNSTGHNASSHSDDRAQFLHRMYTPIIWRATVAPNPVVRINSIQTLLYVFPLSSSDSNNNNITKVCTTIQQLLQDPDIKVRCATAQMTTQLLLLYWDGVPARYIHMILNCR